MANAPHQLWLEFTQSTMTMTVDPTDARMRSLSSHSTLSTILVPPFSLCLARWVSRVALLSGSDERLTSVGGRVLSRQQRITQAHVSVMMRVHMSLRRRRPIVLA